MTAGAGKKSGKATPPIGDPGVAKVFDACPEDLRADLLALRELVFEAALETPSIGPLVETLKWGEPAYLPARPKTGTTVRINRLKGASGRTAVFFHCQTTLVSTFRELYPDRFEFDGNRAIILRSGRCLPRRELKHCIALALTYHLTPAARSRDGVTQQGQVRDNRLLVARRRP